MKKFLVAALALFVFSAAARAQWVAPSGPPSFPPPNVTTPLCNYQSVAPVLTSGQLYVPQCDVNGNLKVAASFTPSGTQDVNLVQVAGASVATGHGTAAGALRVELPTDGTGVVGLNAGSAIVGKVGIDQTTPGSTNGVQVNAALPAGTNVIGKVSIDQTTPGTTNRVAANLDQVAGASVATGHGTASGSIRVELPTDGTGVVGLNAGTNVIGVTGVGQASTTSGQSGELVQGAVTTSQPSYLNGQTSPLNMTTFGSLRVILSTASNQLAMSSSGSDGFSTATSLVNSTAMGYNFNGSSWDRSFTCTNTAAVSVTAGNTTQIVALSGSTVIRVCSFAVSISLTGSFQWITGTGTNCSTPTNITAAMPISTGTPFGMSSGPGVSLFRGTSGGELCLAAVTGNVTGYVTYAQN